MSELIPLLTKPSTRFVYLKKKVPALTYTRIAADLAERRPLGIFRESDPIRTYPNGTVAGVGGRLRRRRRQGPRPVSSSD